MNRFDFKKVLNSIYTLNQYKSKFTKISFIKSLIEKFIKKEKCTLI